MLARRILLRPLIATTESSSRITLTVGRSLQARRTLILKSPYKFIEPINKSFSEQLLKRLWRHGCQDPSKAAIINAFNPADRLSFKELYLRSLSVASFLRQSNFHHGNVVATVLPNLTDFPAIIIGTGLLGGSTSPAGVLLTAKELETQFKDSKTSIIFCADFTLQKVMEAAQNCPKIKKIVCLKSGLLPEGAPEVILPRKVVDYNERIKNLQPEMHWNQIEVNPERDVFVLPYSSGTTGPPKGVMISHKNCNVMLPNFASFMKKEVFPFFNKENPVTANDPQLLFLPFNHIFGLGSLMINLYMGTPTITMPQFKFELMCKMIQEFKVRLMFIVPPVLIQLIHNPVVEKYDLSSLEMLTAGAAPLTSDLMESIHKRLPHLKKIQQGYGMTEVLMASNANSLREKYPYDSVGKLLPGFEMKIIDPDTQQELGAGEHGEVCVRSPQVMMGYFDKPTSTAAIKDDDGWLHTGDIGYFDENGYTYIVDRIKELIKVKGLQVAPAELEALLLTHPNIKDAAVIGIPDHVNGEVPRAYVVTDAGLTEDEVKNHVASQASAYKQLKGGVEFVKEIPKSASGKILRRDLRDRFKNTQIQN